MNYEVVAGNLQQRIAQIVSQYEGDMAVLRTQAMEELAQKDQRIAELEAQVGEQNGVVEEEGDGADAADAPVELSKRTRRKDA